MRLNKTHAGFSKVAMVLFLTLAAVVVLSGVRQGLPEGPLVLGEETSNLAAPSNVTVSDLVCKNGWPWATVKWGSVEGANAYRIKFWDTSGKLLHSEISESASKTTEMYREKDTNISVQSLRRESREREKVVVQDSSDSEKIRLTASSLSAKCGSGEKVESEMEEKEERKQEPEPQLTRETEEKEPSPSEELEAGMTEVEKETGADDGIGQKVEQLEKENQELRKRQSALEALLENLLSSLKNLFPF